MKKVIIGLLLLNNEQIKTELELRNLNKNKL